MMPVWEIQPGNGDGERVFLRISFRFLYSFGDRPNGPSFEYRGEDVHETYSLHFLCNWVMRLFYITDLLGYNCSCGVYLGTDRGGEMGIWRKCCFLISIRRCRAADFGTNAGRWCGFFIPMYVPFDYSTIYSMVSVLYSVRDKNAR